MNPSVPTANNGALDQENYKQVWKKIFTPKVGDWVEFRWQNAWGKHITIHGVVIGIGTDYYSMRVSEQDHKKYPTKWGSGSALPIFASVKKSDKMIRIMSEEEVQMLENLEGGN